MTIILSSFRVHCGRCIGHSPPLRTTAEVTRLLRVSFLFVCFCLFLCFLSYLLLKMENAIFSKTIALYIDIFMKVILKQNKMVCIRF